MRYLITGATGLVGRYTVDQLLARGEHVRVSLRNRAAADAAEERGMEVVFGDLAEGMDARKAVEGIDTVIHCASVVDIAAARQQVWDVNVGATERLVHASVEAEVQRFVLLSSVAVYGIPRCPVHEDAPKEPSGAYGESKWAAEQILWRAHEENNLPAVALRPCAIYGPHDRHTWPALSRAFSKPVLPLPRGGTRLLDLVYVSDLFDATMAAVTRAAAVGKAFNITDGERHSYRDIARAYARLVDRRPWIAPVPGALFRLLLRTARAAGRVARAPDAALRRLDRLQSLDIDIHYEIDAARRDLAYTPRVCLSEGMERMMEWSRADRNTDQEPGRP